MLLNKDYKDQLFLSKFSRENSYIFFKSEHPTPFNGCDGKVPDDLSNCALEILKRNDFIYYPNKIEIMCQIFSILKLMSKINGSCIYVNFCLF